MRQNTFSKDDNRFRTMLGNLRYKNCTDEDLGYLKSRTVTKANQNYLLTTNFRDVPIITLLNRGQNTVTSIPLINSSLLKTTGLCQ